MARRRASIGFFGVFGRSSDLRQLDAALRAADLHPALVPEGIKLTIVNFMQDHAGEEEPPPHAYPFAADLIAYMVAGPDAFERANGAERRSAAEKRVEAAAEAGEGFDAEMILLTLHAKIANPEVVERYGLSAGEGG